MIFTSKYSFGILRKYTDHIIGFILFLLLTYKFPFTYITFHDEVINTWKGSHFHIFDYSVRPLAFWLNALVMQFAGDSSHALPLFSCFIIFISYFLMCNALDIKTLRQKFLFCILYLSSSLIFTVGQTGMINTIVFGYIAVLIFSIRIYEKKKNHDFLIGIICALGVSIHPTCLYLLPGVCIYFILKVQNIKKISIIIAGMFLPFAVMEVLYGALTNLSFFEIYFNSLNRLSKFDFRYEQPFDFYWKILWKDYGSFIFLTFVGQILSKEKHHNLKYLLPWLIMTIITLLIASSISWKFPRVFFSFIPLILVCFYEINTNLLRSSNRRSLLVITAMAFIGLNTSLNQIIDFRKQIKKRYHNHSARYDYLKSFNLKKGIIIREVESSSGTSFKLQKIPGTEYIKGALYLNDVKFKNYRLTKSNLLESENFFKDLTVPILFKKEYEYHSFVKQIREAGFHEVFKDKNVLIYLPKNKLNATLWQRQAL